MGVYLITLCNINIYHMYYFAYMKNVVDHIKCTSNLSIQSHLYVGYSIMYNYIPPYFIMIGTNILDYVLPITAHTANL